MNGILLVFNMAMNICRKTVFTKCSAADWITICLFLVVMIIAVVMAVRLVASEQTLK